MKSQALEAFPQPAIHPADASAAQQARGMWLGLLAVAMFALTLPMTRMAIGSDTDPQLSPLFVTLGRAAVAGLLSTALLLARRTPLPGRMHRKALGLAVLGNTLGYPLLLGYALRSVSAGHAAVVTALLPLATAAIAALVLHQRARLGFWLCAVAGSTLVIVFSLLRGGGAGFWPGGADLLLLGAVLAASVGYVYGAQATPALGAEQVICWVTALALPLTLPGLVLLWPAQPVSAAAWIGFAYVSLFSMWIGMFVWYHGLALGGALRVSQAQLLQPFLAILSAVALLGEPLDLVTLLFAVAVMATVLLGKRLARPR